MFNMILNGLKWSQMVLNGLKTLTTNSIGWPLFNLVLVWYKIVQFLTKMSSKLVLHNQVSWSTLHYITLHFTSLRYSKEK